MPHPWLQWLHAQWIQFVESVVVMLLLSGTWFWMMYAVTSFAFADRMAPLAGIVTYLMFTPKGKATATQIIQTWVMPWLQQLTTFLAWVAASGWVSLFVCLWF